MPTGRPSCGNRAGERTATERKLETTLGPVELAIGGTSPPSSPPTLGAWWTWGEVAIALTQRKAVEVMSLLLGHRYTHETVSALTDQTLERLEAFRQRPLPEELAWVCLDGLRAGLGVQQEVV